MNHEKIDPNQTIKMVERCLATVWDRPWLKERQLLFFECKPHLHYSEYFSDGNISADQMTHKTGVDDNNQQDNNLVM